MATQVQRRKGTTTQHSTFTGASAELTVDTTKNTVVVHDGVTAGGTPLAKESGSALSPASLTLPNGTANGVAYLNGSKVLTTGSALTFNGTNLGIGTSSPGVPLDVQSNTGANGIRIRGRSADSIGFLQFANNAANTFSYIGGDGSYLRFDTGSSEQMRLTSTGLGIGTSSPTNKLSVSGNANITGNTTLGDASNDTVTVNGYMGVGGAGSASNALVTVSSALTGSGQGGFYANITGTSVGTNELSGFRSYIATAAASYTVADVSNFRAFNVVKGAGSTITNQHGVLIADQTQGTNNYGITSLVSSGTNKWNIYASGTAQNYFAGNVGIGTSSPVTFSNQTSVTINGTSVGRADFQVGGATQGYVAALSGYLNVVAGSGNYLRFDAGGSERLRIDSSGNLLVGRTSSSPSAGFGGGTGFNAFSNGAVGTGFSGAGDSWYTQRDTTGNFWKFYYGTINSAPTTIGTISTNGTSTTYNTSSDYRLKDITGPITTSGAYIDSLNPVEGTWKADGSTFVGLIAHEVQEASRTPVATGVKDGEEMQGMDYSSAEIIANLIAEVKALRQRLAAAGI